MRNLTIALPDDMRKWVDAQVKAGGYTDAAEFIRDLVRRHRDERAHDVVDALLLEGLDSGPAIAVNDAYWEDKERRARRRVAEKRKRRA